MKDGKETLKKLVGTQSKCVLEKMQNSTISYSLHIACYFKTNDYKLGYFIF